MRPSRRESARSSPRCHFTSFVGLGSFLRNSSPEELGATQPEISKIEHRTDMCVSTLRRFVEAMGGKLEIITHFPEGTVRITQFRELDAANQ